MPRLPPGETELKGTRQGGELHAVAICAFLAALALYAFVVSHAARWAMQTGFLLSKWALYIVLVAAAVSFANAFGSRLFAACAPCCEGAARQGGL